MPIFDLPRDLLARFSPAGTGGAPAPAAADKADKGAYILILRLGRPLTFPWRKASHTLPAGTYLYAGNAHGPGGIAARLRHHLRRGKRPHWHIDHLTNAADEIHAFTQPAGQECAIINYFMASGRFTAPLAGFGSSDCRTCETHLLRLGTPA